MIVLPIQVNDREYDVLMVLEDENLERIKAGDPAELNLAKFPDKWSTMRLRKLQVGWLPSAVLKATIIKVQETGDVAHLIDKFFKGWKVEPQDDSMGPQKMRGN